MQPVLYEQDLVNSIIKYGFQLRLTMLANSQQKNKKEWMF